MHSLISDLPAKYEEFHACLNTAVNVPLNGVQDDVLGTLKVYVSMVKCTLLYIAGMLVTFQLFEKLKEERPDFASQVVPVQGDVMDDGLGISADDLKLLQRDVSVVIHSAAIVNFNEEIRSVS